MFFICLGYSQIFGQSSEIIKVYNGKDSIEIYKNEIAVRFKIGKDIKEIGKISRHRFGIILMVGKMRIHLTTQTLDLKLLAKMVHS